MGHYTEAISVGQVDLLSKQLINRPNQQGHNLSFAKI